MSQSQAATPEFVVGGFLISALVKDRYWFCHAELRAWATTITALNFRPESFGFLINIHGMHRKWV